MLGKPSLKDWCYKNVKLWKLIFKHIEPRIHRIIDKFQTKFTGWETANKIVGLEENIGAVTVLKKIRICLFFVVLNNFGFVYAMLNFYVQILVYPLARFN